MNGVQVPGGIAVLAVFVLFLAIGGLLLIFGFIKFIHDLKMESLREAGEHYDKHFINLQKFINDPAAPQDLTSVAIHFSEVVNNIDFGKFALSQLQRHGQPIKSSASIKSDAVMHLLADLGDHRPDLVEIFSQLLLEGQLASIYRYIAEEMSPLRAFKELKTAREIEKRQENRTSYQALSSIGSIPFSYTG